MAVAACILFRLLLESEGAGIVRCAPIGHHDVADNVPTTDDPRFYTGRFTNLRHHNENGIIFVDTDEHLVRISNVSCLVIFDE